VEVEVDPVVFLVASELQHIYFEYLLNDTVDFSNGFVEEGEAL